jgi:hypothetical protein
MDTDPHEGLGARPDPTVADCRYNELLWSGRVVWLLVMGATLYATFGGWSVAAAAALNAALGIARAVTHRHDDDGGSDDGDPDPDPQPDPGEARELAVSGTGR